MSERTLKFYEDGPSVFTLEQYQGFCKITKEADFDRMVYIWLDEGYPDHIRELCLRCLVRQGNHQRKIKTAAFATHTYHHFSIGRILHCLGETGQIPWMFRYRTKLTQELYRELLYSLQHCLRETLSYDHEHRDVDHLIELLLPYVSNAESKEIWTHHSINKTFDTKSMLELYERDDSNIPDWLRDYLKKCLSDLVRNTVNRHSKYFDIQKRINMEYIDTKETSRPMRANPIAAIINHIASYRYNANKFGFSAWLVSMLEKQIPQSWQYAERYHIIDVILLLPDDETTYKFARRHLLLLKPSDYVEFCNHRALIALRYIRDLVMHEYPTDTEFHDHLYDIIRYCLTKTAVTN